MLNKALYKTLFFLATIGKLAFMSIGLFFLTLGGLCDMVVDELKGGWRRSSQETRLWRWAKKIRNENN
jgi:hypothetical protein